MKTRLLIVEDNFCKYFTIKQVLEAQLKIAVTAKDCESCQELFETAKTFKPDTVIFRPDGGVDSLLKQMKKRGTNRLNTEIALLLAEDFDFDTELLKERIHHTRRLSNAA